MDFITLARYKTHDDDILGYIEYALMRIEIWIKAFARQRKYGYFNYLKMHVITYYVHQIKRYGSAVYIDTDYSKYAYIGKVKDLYKRTNKRRGFEL